MSKRWSSARCLMFLPSWLAACATASAAPFTIERTGEAYHTLAAAVASIGPGAGTIRIAPGTYYECAVQTAGFITYRAAPPLSATFRGGICEGKATLVLRGSAAVVDGLVFERLYVDDGNGAGIRIEKGSLAVSRSLFRDSDQGILGAADPVSDIAIDRSTFSRLGRCDGDQACAHSIYIGAFRSLTVRRSRFEKGRGGHYVKSRAPLIEVTDSSFDDSKGRKTDYMIDLPEGAAGSIVGNVFSQGADKANHSAFVAVAAEGQRHSSRDLAVTDNQAMLSPRAEWKSALVADWSGEPKRIARNRIGPGIEPLKPIERSPPE